MNSKKIRNRKHYVYGLIDPFDLKIKYIGLTNNIRKRSSGHRTSRYYNHNDKLLTWVVCLRELGTIPEFKVLKECDDYYSGHRIEKMLIKKLDYQLFNKDHNNK